MRVTALFAPEEHVYTFIDDLLRRCPDQGYGELESLTTPSETRQLSALIVDDDPTVRASLKRLLTREGFAVRMASNGVDLVRRCLESSDGPIEAPFDVIVTDLDMPYCDGLEALHALRRRGVNAPVILMTARPRTELARHASEIGATTVVLKPFAVSELRSHLDQIRDSQPPAPSSHHCA